MDERTLGKELFGRWVRLAVARWALHHDSFYQGEAAEAIGYPPSAVRQELDRLVQLGMLLRVSPEGSRRVYYVHVDSPLWEIIRAADRVVADPATVREAAP